MFEVYPGVKYGARLLFEGVEYTAIGSIPQPDDSTLAVYLQEIEPDVPVFRTVNSEEFEGNFELLPDFELEESTS